MNRSPISHGGIVLAAVIATCLQPSCSGADPDLEISNLRISENPHCELSRFVSLRTSVAARVTVSLSDPAGAVREIDPRAAPGEDHRVALVGLRADTTYVLTVTATTDDGETATSSPETFETGSLPGWLPRFTVDIPHPDLVAPGYRIFNIWLKTDYVDNSSTSLAVLMVVDETGEVRWYRDAPDATVGGVFIVLDDGRIYYLRSGYREVMEVDWTGYAHRTWSTADVAPEVVLMHGAASLPGGNLLVACETLEELSDGSTVRDYTVYELTADFEVVDLWRMRDFASLEGLVDFESNAMDYIESEDAFVVLFHDRFVKISRADHELVWVMGGPDDDFTYTGDTYMPVDIHGPHFLDSGNVLLLDNGIEGSHPFARVVELAPDLSSFTVQEVWQYAHDDPLVPAMGSAQRLAGGNTLICEGARMELAASPPRVRPRIIEVDDADPPLVLFDMAPEPEFDGATLERMYLIFDVRHVETPYWP